MKIGSTLQNFCFLLVIAAWIGCQDKKILDGNRDTNHLVISTLDDAQQLFDNMTVFGEVPAAGQLSCDDFLISDSTLTSLSTSEFNTYTWQREIYGKDGVSDWNVPYQQVFYANAVLDVLPRLADYGIAAYKSHIKGTALFFRGHAFFQVAQLYANTYDSLHAEGTLGIPIRLTPDPEIGSTRSSLKGTYDRIITDLKESIPLLPYAIDKNRKNRPTQAAAYGILARIALFNGDYVNALKYADSVLRRIDKLINYNDVLAYSNPFTANGEEVIYQAHLLSNTNVLENPECFVDSILYKSYADNDLRKVLFFKTNMQGYHIPGYSYTGTIYRFGGLSTNEIYLTKAECLARLGNNGLARQTLNALLSQRYKNGTFIPIQVNSTGELLNTILEERRKELVFTSIRWLDIRRLNRINPGISLTRLCNGNLYNLPANDARFTLPIPPDVISLSGMQQNPR